MIFTELRFLLLFAACWGSFFALPRRWRAAVLAFWGAAFYFTYAGPFLAVALVLTALAFFARRSAVVAVVAGAVTIGLLVYYKLTLVADPLPGLTTTPTAFLVPLGLSYLTFELLHVIVAQRRGRITGMTWPDLLAFVFFAPARMAGPIKRFPAFMAAINAAERSGANVYAGTLRILIGLAKKILIADVVAMIIAERPSPVTASAAWTIVLLYSLRIYFDFSAYSDIAIGFSRTLGIVLPENFRRPYFAENIRQFWDRWHITLSQWVRDYVFTPFGRLLFRSRLRPYPVAIAAISYLVTFATVGAWHGLTAAFLIWGLYHGVLLSLYHIIRQKTPPRVTDHAWYVARPVRLAGVALTFLCVTVGWVPFMLPLPEAGKMLALMFGVAP
jgi:alginate O-acetyltransferase complex protein AlgI